MNDNVVQNNALELVNLNQNATNLYNLSFHVSFTLKKIEISKDSLEELFALYDSGVYASQTLDIQNEFYYIIAFLKYY